MKNKQIRTEEDFKEIYGKFPTVSEFQQFEKNYTRFILTDTEKNGFKGIKLDHKGFNKMNYGK